MSKNQEPSAPPFFLQEFASKDWTDVPYTVMELYQPIATEDHLPLEQMICCGGDCGCDSNPQDELLPY